MSKIKFSLIAVCLVWSLSTTLSAQKASLKIGDLEVKTETLKAAEGTEVFAELCRLVVPENRTKPDSRPIEIAFTRLKSKAENPKAPLVYLAGGPGSSASGMANNPHALGAWLPVLEVCDVILLDQRATGRSKPNLRYFSKKPVPREVFVDENLAHQRFEEIAKEAVEHFRQQGVDLDGYNSNESADDVNAIREALGLDKINLFGFSYGTHLALATIRRHGDHLENVIAVGVEGLHETYKPPFNLDTQFRKLSLMVAADKRVGPFVPDMVALLKRVFKKLEKEPMLVEIFDRQSNQKIKVPVGKFGLQFILRRDIGDASDLPVFPKLLYSIDQGDPSILQWFVQKRWRVSAVDLMGLFVDGASGASPERLAMIEKQAKLSLFGNAANFPWPDINKAIGVKDLGEAFRAPLVSDARTLFLSGSLDWNTPPHQAEFMRWGMPNATHIVVENAGHEQIYVQPKVFETMIRFLKGEDVREVKVVLPPLRFAPIEGSDPKVSHPSLAGVN